MSTSIPLVVVVDDSLEVRTMLTRQIEAHGYEVTAAIDGEQALEVCGGRPPDADLLDLNLPGISGYEVLTALRSMPSTDGVPSTTSRRERPVRPPRR